MNLFIKMARETKTGEVTFEKANQVYLSAKSLVDELRKKRYSVDSLFSNTLDLSLIGKDGLDEDLLKSDGFEYSEKL